MTQDSTAKRPTANARSYAEAGYVLAKGGGQRPTRIPVFREVRPRGRVYPAGSVPGGLRRKMRRMEATK